MQFFLKLWFPRKKDDVAKFSHILYLLRKAFLNTVNIGYLEYLLSQTFIVLNFSLLSSALLVTAFIYLIVILKSSILNFHYVELYSMLKECIRKFDQMFIFSYFNKTTCRKQSSILTVFRRKQRSIKGFIFSLLLPVMPFRMGLFGAAHRWGRVGGRGRSYNDETWHSYTLTKEEPRNLWIKWDTTWVLLTSAFFHRKSANFAISENKYIDCSFFWVFKDF